MSDFITFRHSFNAGDLITVLPGIKHICEKNNKKAIIYQRLDLPANYGHPWPHPVASDDGIDVCMNRKMFEMLKPLIEAQAYVHAFEVWEGQEIVFDYDKTRHNSQMPLPGGSIHKWPSLIYPQLECDLNTAWINVLSDEVVSDGLVCLNFTERYRNPYISYFFLRKYQKKCFFLGTKDEWRIFVDKWGLWDIPYIRVNNFLELSGIIKACKLFIGNQSFCWHIADAIKIPRILEVCSQYPNTFPTGPNGYSFITQEALEFRFHQLLNEPNAETTKSNVTDY